MAGRQVRRRRPSNLGKRPDTAIGAPLRHGLTAGGVTRAGRGHISKVGNASKRHSPGSHRPSLMGWVPWPGICAVPVGLRSPIWIRGILKSVAFSALCARKLAELAKPDVLSEVTVGQRLTINFVVSSGLAKLSRLNFLIPGSLVRVQPGVVFHVGEPYRHADSSDEGTLFRKASSPSCAICSSRCTRSSPLG